MSEEAMVGRPDRESAADPGDANIREMLASLEKLSLNLRRALEHVGAQRLPDVRGGVDYFAEVRRFEVGLIQTALAIANGNQRQAAKLLNMKPNTLNVKIKNYSIRQSHEPSPAGAGEAESGRPGSEKH